jgi:type II secretion system protein G
MIKKEDGFTLIEIMTVIIIIAILTGIAVIGYLNFAPRAKESRTELEIKNISTALSTYYTDNNSYPITNDYPDCLQTGGYMENVPINDAWGTAYQYSSPDGLSYTMKSFGENKENGGGDDIVFIDGSMIETGLYPN